MKTKAVKRVIKYTNDEGARVEIPALVPAHRADFEDWLALKDSTIYNANITRSRAQESNYQDQFFAILFFTWFNWPEAKRGFKTSELFRKFVMYKIEAGDLVGIRGDAVFIPWSLAYDNTELDHDKFMASVYNPGLDFCSDSLGMDREELVKKSIEFGYNRALYSGKGRG